MLPRQQDACIREASADYDRPGKGTLWIFRVSTSRPGETFGGRDVNVMRGHALDDKPSQAEGARSTANGGRTKKQ